MNKLTSQIITVVYKGYLFQGDCTNEVLAKMHSMGVGFIGGTDYEDIFGIKAQAVYKRVKRWEKLNPERMALVKQESDFQKIVVDLIVEEGLTIFEAAQRLDCSPGLIRKVKKTLIPNRTDTMVAINRRRRRIHLCRMLFGVQYNPGVKFIEFCHNEIVLNDDILDYYIKGEGRKESYERVAHLSKLGKILRKNYDMKTLLDGDIICQANRL